MTPEQLKDSILQRAMEGKLVPQDPNDEPASELLKRIKAEKEKLIKEGKIKRDKNETEIFRGDDGLHYEKFPDGSVKQIEVPYEIPESWEWVRLENITKVINDGVHSTPNYINSGIPFLSVKDMSGGRLSFENTKFISEEDHLELSKRCKPERNDIILSKVGTTGIPVKVDVEQEFSIFVSLALLKFVHPFNPDFLVELIKSPIVYNQSKEGTRGVGNKNLVLSVIKKFLIPLPPVNEQTRILNRINKIHKSVLFFEKLYTANKKIKEEFPEKLRKSILQYAMQGKLVPQDATDEPVEVLLGKIREEKQRLFEEGKLKKKDLQESIIYQGDNSSYKHIPKSWVLTTLGNVGFWRSGATPSRSNPLYFGGDIPWLKTGDLNDGYIYHIPENITTLALKETSVKLIPSDSVLIAMYGATIGKIGILTFPATTNQACCACTPYNILNNQYLFWYLRFSRDKFIEMAEGGAQPNISKEKIVGFPIALPPIREQRKIVNKIECLLDKVSLL